MNRAEKRAKEKAKKQAAKAARYARNGGKTRYAQKAVWRNSNIGGQPIPCWAPTWEQAQPIVRRALKTLGAKLAGAR